MTAANGYVWFLPTWFTDTWWSGGALSRHQNPMLTCSDAEMVAAVQGYWALSYLFSGPEDGQVVGGITVKQWEAIYQNKLDILVGFHSAQCIYILTAFYQM